MRTYIFIINMLLCIGSFAQHENNNKALKDSTKTHQFGLRIGADLSKVVKTGIIDEYTTFEINADYKLNKRYYIALEIGMENRTMNETQINFNANGTYFKLGVDYNMYENWLDMNNMIYAGFRYAVSNHKQTLNRYNVYNTDLYWGENLSVNTPFEFEANSSHWVELIVGIKVEVWNDLYLGLNIQLKRMVSNTNPYGFENLYVPGFGQTYTDSNWGAGFGYTVSYFIPFYKK